MATLDDVSGNDEAKRTLELSASVASTGSTLRSASPVDTIKTPKVRFESLPLPPTQAMTTPKKPTLAQIFNFDTDGPRQRHKFGFNFTPPPPDKGASEGSGGDDDHGELMVFTGDEKTEEEYLNDKGEQHSEGEQSDEGDELMSSAASAASASPDGSLGPSSPPDAFHTKADTPPRLYVTVPLRGVTPTMAPPSNLKPPPLQGKTLKIEHHLEVRTPSKVKFTVQSPEASEPASVDPPSYDVHQPTAKLAALQAERITIAQIKKQYLSYAQQVRNEKSKAKLLAMPRRVSPEKKRAWQLRKASGVRSRAASLSKRSLNNSDTVTEASLGSSSPNRPQEPRTPAALDSSPASSGHSAASLSDVVAYMEANPALVAPPITLETDLSLVARLTPVLINEVREKMDTFRRHLREADDAGESLEPYMAQWKRWVEEHNAFVLHDKLRGPSAL